MRRRDDHLAPPGRRCFVRLVGASVDDQRALRAIGGGDQGLTLRITIGVLAGITPELRDELVKLPVVDAVSGELVKFRGVCPRRQERLFQEVETGAPVGRIGVAEAL